MSKIKVLLSSLLIAGAAMFATAQPVSAQEADTFTNPTDIAKKKSVNMGNGISSFALGLDPAFDKAGFEAAHENVYGEVELAQGESIDVSAFYSGSEELKFMEVPSTGSGEIAYKDAFENAGLNSLLETKAGFVAGSIYGYKVGDIGVAAYVENPADPANPTMIAAFNVVVSATPVTITGPSTTDLTVTVGEEAVVTFATDVENPWWFWLTTGFDNVIADGSIADWNRESLEVNFGTFTIKGIAPGSSPVTFTIGTYTVSITLNVVNPVVVAPSTDPAAPKKGGVATGDSTNIIGFASLLVLSGVVAVVLKKKEA